VLITGEPGAGKTWHARRLAVLLGEDWRTLSIDVAAAMNAVDFLRLIGHALGVSVTSQLGAARLQVQGVLQDEAADGRRWLLVVDEAHRSSLEVWDEIQAIVNQLGGTGGFAALLVLGQTELLRALSNRRHSAFASSLSLHVHLLPLDLDEARELLGYPGRASAAVELAIEELHRDAHGNPGKLIRMAQARLGLCKPDLDREERRQVAARRRLHTTCAITPAEPRISDNDKLVAVSAGGEERAAKERSGDPPLIPTIAPIREEDGMVEVGWEGDMESEFVPAGGGLAAGAPWPAETAVSTAEEELFTEEVIDDRYAALQARAEWTRNQGRSAGEKPGTTSVELGRSPSKTAEGEQIIGSDPAAPFDPATVSGAPAATPPAGFRAEGQHEFAPYSQLFTRLRARG
jgi:general secretion pathway protein A